MSLVFSICIGSTIQVALVLAPLLVIISWFLGQPMDLVFQSPLNLFAIAGEAFVVRAVAADGESAWFEGLLLSASISCWGWASSSWAPADGLPRRMRNELGPQASSQEDYFRIRLQPDFSSRAVDESS